LELELPLQDASSCSRSFSLRYVARVLQGDGKSRVGQWIVRSEYRKRHRRGNRLVELTRIAERANQPVMRLHMRWVGGNGGPECLRRFRRQTSGQQVESALSKRVGSMRICHGWF